MVDRYNSQVVQQERHANYENDRAPDDSPAAKKPVRASQANPDHQRFALRGAAFDSLVNRVPQIIAELVRVEFVFVAHAALQKSTLLPCILLLILIAHLRL